MVLRVDMHSHGEHSDIKGTLDESVQWHKDRGFDAMAITNHDYLTPPSRINELDYSIIPGIEWSSYDTHILGFFEPQTYTKVYNDIMNDTEKRNLLENSGRCISNEYRTQYINLIHSYGGYVCVAHPTLTLLERISNIKSYSTLPCDIPGLLQLRALGVDAFEVANTIPDVMADDFTTFYGIPKIAGTDLHEVEDGIVIGKTLIDIGENPVSTQSIFNGLKGGNSTIEYNSWWNTLSDKLRLYLITGIVSFLLVIITVIVFISAGCRHLCCKTNSAPVSSNA